ncbi:MAG: thiolase domain-containing protein [Parcubacteria group bacterium]|nr:thiolase domain-containing protein [Parcubacteria group bacterium]
MYTIISGIGMTRFGEIWDKSFEDLFREAVDLALLDSGMNVSEIEACFVGTMLCGETAMQSHAGALLCEQYGVNIPCFRVEGACASGGLAVHRAVTSIEAKQYKKVLVVGVEKMTDFSAETVASFLMQAASSEERLAGATFPALYAMMAREHMETFGTTREQLAAASIISHRNGAKNPLAQFQKEISVNDVLESSMIADPLTLLECSPISDGAGAVILSAEEARKTDNDVCIVASEVACDTLSLSGRKTLIGLKSTQEASRKIFATANLKPADIDLVEVHDCFSIAGLMALEDIGFANKGEGGALLMKMMNHSDMKPAFNTSGGLKACGHPVGATGVKQIAEAAWQLRGQAGKRQAPDVKYALTHNVGGSGATCVMHLLGKV